MVFKLVRVTPYALNPKPEIFAAFFQVGHRRHERRGASSSLVLGDSEGKEIGVFRGGLVLGV